MPCFEGTEKPCSYAAHASCIGHQQLHLQGVWASCACEDIAKYDVSSFPGTGWLCLTRSVLVVSRRKTREADSLGACCAGAAMQVSFSTFEGIAVKLKDSGRFGVVQSIQGLSCTVALGAEDPEKGVVLPEQPETTTAVRRLHTGHLMKLTLLAVRWCIVANAYCLFACSFQKSPAVRSVQCPTAGLQCAVESWV